MARAQTSRRALANRAASGLHVLSLCAFSALAQSPEDETGEDRMLMAVQKPKLAVGTGYAAVEFTTGPNLFSYEYESKQPVSRPLPSHSLVGVPGTRSPAILRT